MLAISRDEVDDRCRGLNGQCKVKPAAVRLKLGITSLGKEISTNLVQRTYACITTTGDVDRREIEWQADKVVTQRASYKFVDFVANLAGHAADDGAGRFLYRCTASRKFHRIQKRLDQTNVAGCLTISREPVYGFIQLRVAKAVNGMREFCGNCRINVDGVRENERVNVWIDRADELFKHKMLVNLLCGVARCVEQTLTIPLQCCSVRWHFSDRDIKPFVKQGNITIGDKFSLDLVDAIIVFRMEHVVDCGQSDVLVRTTITSNIMLIKQFIVVSGSIAACVNGLGIAHIGIGIRSLTGFWIRCV